MSKALDRAVKYFLEAFETFQQNKTIPLDVQAEVRRVEDGIAWVHIPGGVEETPVKLTIGVKPGDKVQARVSGGRAFLVGNETAPPTDDTKAKQAVIQVEKAEQKVEEVKEAVKVVETTVQDQQRQITIIDESAVTGVVVQYAKSTSPTVAPTSGWSSASPTWESGKYIWQRTVTTIAGEQIVSNVSCIQGAKGEQGQRGEDGTSVTILGHYDTEAELIAEHPTGSPGDSYLVGGDLYVWNGNAWENVGNIQGPQGEQGIQGPKGDKGDKGNTGDQGPRGPQGEQGLQGEQGPKGNTGEQGPKGDKGDKGDKGNKGDTGAAGAKGDKGDDGITYYTYFAYGTSSSGANFSPTPFENNTYIGVCITTASTQPLTPASYTWSLTKGEQGAQGEAGAKGDKGEDGITRYTYFAYGTSSSGADFSTTPFASSTYIGVCTTTSSTQPLTPASYTWSLTKGNTGAQGPQGIQGVQGEKGDKGDRGEQGVQGNQGPQGDTGVGVTALQAEYYLSTSDTSTTGGSWQTTPPAYIEGRHYWTRTKITWSTGSVSYTTEVLDQGITDANSAALQALRKAGNAEDIAEATGQHFWADDDGLHVSSEPDLPAATRNTIWNSLGMLFRKGLNPILGILTGDNPRVAIYDGHGSGEEHEVASFGASARIGKSEKNHLQLDDDSVDFMDGDTLIGYVGSDSARFPVMHVQSRMSIGDKYELRVTPSGSLGLYLM